MTVEPVQSKNTHRNVVGVKASHRGNADEAKIFAATDGMLFMASTRQFQSAVCMSTGSQLKTVMFASQLNERFNWRRCFVWRHASIGFPKTRTIFLSIFMNIFLSKVLKSSACRQCCVTTTEYKRYLMATARILHISK